MTNETNPMALSFFRWVTALCFILPFGYKRLLQEKETIRENFFKLLVLAFFSVSAYNSVIYFSADYTTATNMAFVIVTTPATTFVLSWLILGDKAGTLKLFGMILAFVGMGLIIFKASLANALSLTINTGDILTCFAVISWAVYSVLLKHFKLTMDPVAFLTTIILLGLPIILPFYLWETSIYGGINLNPKIAGTFFFLGLFPSILSYLCWNEGVRIAGPNTASIFMYLVPVIASFIAYLFLGERLYYYHFGGAAIIFAGLFLAIRE